MAERARVILKHNYIRNRGASPQALAKARDTGRAALRYYQHRPLGPEEPERGFFGPDGGLTRDEAHRLLDEHQARGWLVHRLILSPADEVTPEDLRALTRAVLGRLEDERGLTLHWAAVEHRHSDHPHVHIVLAGGGDRPTLGGQERAEVRLATSDYARMKADALDYCLEEVHDRERWDRACALEHGRDGGDAAGAPRREPEIDHDDDWTP